MILTDFLVLAQNNVPISNNEQEALDLISGALGLSDAMIAAWDSLWKTLLSPDGGQPSPVWNALKQLGLVLAGFGLLYTALTQAQEIIAKSNWMELFQMATWTIIVAIVINSSFLGNSIYLARQVGYGVNRQIMDIQINQISVRKALTTFGLTAAAKQEIETLYAECSGEQGADFQKCWESKKERAQQIVDNYNNTFQGKLVQLGEFVGGLIQRLPLDRIPGGGVINGAIELAKHGFDLGATIRGYFTPIIRFILWVIQWGFTLALEASLLMTALFAPIAMGLSILPVGGKPIFAFMTGFASLLGLQIGYNLIVGFSAVVLLNAKGEVVSDIAFLFFMAIFAPFIGGKIMEGGGRALFEAINHAGARVAQAYGSMLSFGVRVAGLAVGAK